MTTAGIDGLKTLTGLRLRPVLATSEAIQREMKKRLGVGADTIDTLDEASAIVTAFLGAQFSNSPRHLRRIDQVIRYEKDHETP